MGADEAARRYLGDAARGYEARRTRQKRWRREHEELRDALINLDVLGRTLDVPCGTGRFHELYRSLEIPAVGVDASPDMLELARARGMEAYPGDVRAIPFADESFDAVVCFRLLNQLTVDEMRQAFSEFARVARRFALVTVRLGEPNPKKNASPHRNYDVVAAYHDVGWKVIHAAPLDGRGYNLLALERTS